MTTLERCELANQYHNQGFNCCQSIVAVYGDRTGLTAEQALTLSAAFGGGLRSGEVCGAISGAVMVLGTVFPHIHPNCPEEKARISQLTAKYVKRFREQFGHVCCRDLLSNPIERNEENTPTACALGITQHCMVLIVSAISLLDQLLQEEGM